MSSLPTDAQARKAIPIHSGFVKYFPDAMAAVAQLSQIGNDQHHPGTPLHWDKDKSTDELDALMRHLTDEAAGTDRDEDGVLHAVKVAWRAMANLQRMADTGVNILQAVAPPPPLTAAQSSRRCATSAPKQEHYNENATVKP